MLLKNFIKALPVTWFMALSAQNPLHLSGYAQGTTYHITYIDSANRNFFRAIDSLLKDFDLSVSTYNPHSVISRINRSDPGIRPDSYFLTCFTKAKEVWTNTNGAFDPTVYPLVNMWGFGPGKKQKIEKTKIDSVMHFVGFEKIRISHGKVRKKDPRVALDFNAFAQGYSVDVVSSFLKSKGIFAFVVEIGGELYASGTKANAESWTVGIEQPIDNKEDINPYKALVQLKDLAMATSGNYRRFVIEDGIKYAHHIDPKTGFPTKNNLLSASIFAKDCITADAYATGVLVMGFDEAKVFLAKHHELMAYLIYSDNSGAFNVWMSDGLKTLITELPE
jgi:thiamine biosynthesis lipoprotein